MECKLLKPTPFLWYVTFNNLCLGAFWSLKLKTIKDKEFRVFGGSSLRNSNFDGGQGFGLEENLPQPPSLQGPYEFHIRVLQRGLQKGRVW